MSGNHMDFQSSAVRGGGHPARRSTPVRDVTRLARLSPTEQSALGEVTVRYSFCATEYYLGLVDWSDPSDPIRTLIVPQEAELEEFGTPDASNEASNTVVLHQVPSHEEPGR